MRKLNENHLQLVNKIQVESNNQLIKINDLMK